MIARDPDITRLLDRLTKARLGGTQPRQAGPAGHLWKITAAGLKLLRRWMRRWKSTPRDAAPRKSSEPETTDRFAGAGPGRGGQSVRPKEVLCIPARKFKGNSKAADKSVRPTPGLPAPRLAARFPEGLLPAFLLIFSGKNPGKDLVDIF